LPAEESDVYFDRAVVELGLEENLFGLCWTLAEQGEFCIPTWLAWDQLDVVDKLDLVDFINRRQGNFGAVQLMCVKRHCC
jgi:hypothetical protein